MKKITEMTEQEILALTDSDLDLLIKLGMAEAGIKLLDMPVEPKYFPTPKKDCVAYAVSGFNLVFKEKELADQLSHLLSEIIDKSFAPDYERGNYELKFLKNYNQSDYSFSSVGNVTKEDYFNRETLASFSELVKENNKAKKEYEEQLAEYNDAHDKASYIRDDIYEAHATVVSKYQKMENIKRQYLVYLKLANGDSDIAMNFLEKAYEVDEDTLHYIHPDAPRVTVE